MTAVADAPGVVGGVGVVGVVEAASVGKGRYRLAHGAIGTGFAGLLQVQVTMRTVGNLAVKLGLGAALECTLDGSVLGDAVVVVSAT